MKTEALFPKEDKHCCNTMVAILDRGRSAFNYDSQKRHFFIKECDNEKNSSFMMVNTLLYCPWCSKKLPNNLKDEWYDVLEKEYRLDEPWSDEQKKQIPSEFHTNEWWKKRGL